jgi:hypothetical protein
MQERIYLFNENYRKEIKEWQTLDTRKKKKNFFQINDMYENLWKQRIPITAECNTIMLVYITFHNVISESNIM